MLSCPKVFFPNKIIFHLSNRLVNMSHLMTFNLMLNEVENAAISDFPFGVFKPLTNPVSVTVSAVTAD